MAEPDRVQVAKAKGRPMLSWVGKRPLREVRAFPSQLVERFAPEVRDGAVAADVDWSEWPDRFDRGGLLFHGDNKEVLAHLLASGFRGKVDLVYIDPPFDSGADYVRKVQLRGASGSARIEGETYTLGEQIQYTDIWANDTYLQFMFERLLLIKELLSSTGNLVLHCDPRRGYQLRMLLDEVLGSESFINEVVWRRSDAHSDAGQGAKHLGAVHDTLIVYAKSRPSTWNDIYTALPKSTIDNWYRNIEEGTGRRYNKADMTGPGGTAKGSPIYDWKGVSRPWRFSLKRMEELDALGLIVYSDSGMPYLKRYLDESKGVPLQDWWDDIQMIRGIQRRGDATYPTEKPEALIDRVVRLLSNPGDLVLDCFIGSGTTAAVAQKLGRRWIGADINKGAIQTTTKRLMGIIGEQIAATGGQLALADDEDAPPRPAQAAFTVRRVNDYDLQIQHNEALELAVEHLGVQRTRADTFFQGTLGRELVYIVPFDHPTTQLDLQAVIDEIERRPGEERDVVVVGLGRELSTIAWLEAHNRHRAVNKVRVIDLRTDEKHGRFFEHTPASARVTFERQDDRVRVRIDDVISPSIMERLAGQEGVLAPQVTDWRWIVDSVAIDTAYDGAVFDVDHIDLPERRTDLVEGTYDLVAPGGDRPAAVRITDMLGEEILIVEVRS